MKIARCFFFLFLMHSLMIVSSARATEIFRIGVAPHTSARVIIEMYQPLRFYLAQALGMPVEIVTAPNFTDTVERAIAQKYDLVITTGHQARLLQTDAGYTPLLTYCADFYAVALVAGNSSIKTTADLHGGKALGLSETSLVTLWGLHWLRKNKLDDMNIQYVSASDSVASLLLTGEANVGFTSLANYQQLAPTIQSQLHIFAQSDAMAGRVYLLNKHWKSIRGKVNRALWDFSRSPVGKDYFEKYQLGGYRELRHGELESMNPYAAEVRMQLKAQKK